MINHKVLRLIFLTHGTSASHTNTVILILGQTERHLKRGARNWLTLSLQGCNRGTSLENQSAYFSPQIPKTRYGSHQETSLYHGIVVLANIVLGAHHIVGSSTLDHYWARHSSKDLKGNFTPLQAHEFKFQCLFLLFIGYESSHGVLNLHGGCYGCLMAAS